MKKAVEEVISNKKYKENVMKLGREFNTYSPNDLTAHYITEALQKTGRLHIRSKVEEKIY